MWWRDGEMGLGGVRRVGWGEVGGVLDIGSFKEERDGEGGLGEECLEK